MEVIGSFCFSPPAWHKLRLCCTRPMAAKLADNKTLFCHPDRACDEGSLESVAVFNLYAVILCFVCSLSLLTFCRAKSYKNARHRQNKAQQPFARAVLASTRSAVVCRSQLIVQASGAKELAFHAPTATRKTPLKHHLPFIRCLNGCSLLF